MTLWAKNQNWHLYWLLTWAMTRAIHFVSYPESAVGCILEKWNYSRHRWSVWGWWGREVSVCIKCNVVITLSSGACPSIFVTVVAKHWHRLIQGCKHSHKAKCSLGGKRSVWNGMMHKKKVIEFQRGLWSLIMGTVSVMAVSSTAKNSTQKLHVVTSTACFFSLVWQHVWTWTCATL